MFFIYFHKNSYCFINTGDHHQAAVRGCRDFPRRPGDCDWRGPGQDHEGGQGAEDCLRTVPRHEPQPDYEHHPHDSRGPSQGYPWLVALHTK